jgi:acyl-CoA hydrolase
MVAVDDAGKPVRVPELQPKDAADVRRYKAAELRRTLRREFAERLESVAATGKDVEKDGA